MTNPTSNYGWQMPTSTDLVTDLPADFEVFGQAVDTSLADLKGGTTGQVLAKASNTDMDFVWSADAAGMTNPMTTTGDTIYSSSGSTPARLGIGTTGQVLAVSAGLPAWTTPASSAPASDVASVATRQSTTSNTYTDLATSGPAVTLTTGTKVLVIVSAAMDTNNTSDVPLYMDFAMSGATTRAATDVTALISPNTTRTSSVAFRASSAQRISVTAGSNTFTAKYHTTNNETVFFSNRTITVIDLGS
jgi:hypothetical protein